MTHGGCGPPPPTPHHPTRTPTHTRTTHLEREVKGGSRAAGGIAPVHRPLPVGVLVVVEHAVWGAGTGEGGAGGGGSGVGWGGVSFDLFFLGGGGGGLAGVGKRGLAVGATPSGVRGLLGTAGRRRLPGPGATALLPHRCRSRCPSTRQTPSPAPWHPRTRAPTARRSPAGPRVDQAARWACAHAIPGGPRHPQRERGHGSALLACMRGVAQLPGCSRGSLSQPAHLDVVKAPAVEADRVAQVAHPLGNVLADALLQGGRRVGWGWGVGGGLRSWARDPASPLEGHGRAEDGATGQRRGEARQAGQAHPTRQPGRAVGCSRLAGMRQGPCLRVVDVWRRGVVLGALQAAAAPKGGVVGADGRLVPGQPPAKLVPLAVVTLQGGARGQAAGVWSRAHALGGGGRRARCAGRAECAAQGRLAAPLPPAACCRPCWTQAPSRRQRPADVACACVRRACGRVGAPPTW